MRDHSVQSGYLAVAKEPRRRALALLLSEVSDGAAEVRELLGWILSHCPEIQRRLQELDQLRELYGLEPSAAGLSHALHLESVIRLALGPHWDAAEVILDTPSAHAEHAVTSASDAVFRSEITDVVPLEEVLVALEKTDPGSHDSRREALREHLRERYDGDDESEARK